MSRFLSGVRDFEKGDGGRRGVGVMALFISKDIGQGSSGK